VQKQKQEEEENIDFSKTPNYDKVCHNIRKLMSATVQTFIPEACDALRRDWYPGVSDRGVKENYRARQMVRERIFDDWSKERNGEGIWKESSIQVFFPDWLKTAGFQSATMEKLANMRDGKLKKKISLAEEQKRALERFTTKLPETVIIPEPEPEYQNVRVMGSHLDEEEPMLRQYGNTNDRLMTLFGRINNAIDSVWESFTNSEKEHAPHSTEDIINDYIRPTREFRNMIAFELPRNLRLKLHEDCVSTKRMLDDMIKIIEDAEEKK